MAYLFKHCFVKIIILMLLKNKRYPDTAIKNGTPTDTNARMNKSSAPPPNINEEKLS